MKRAEERVLEAIESAEVSGELEENKVVEIMSFPVALILVRATKQDHMMRRYALAEAKRVEYFLEHERKEDTIVEIFRSALGINLEHARMPGNIDFRILVADYLKRAGDFHRPEWKLVNRSVQNGKVYLTQHDLIRLIREEIQSLITERLRSVNMPKLPEEIEVKAKELITLLPPPKSPFSILSISPDNYPPCVKEALARLDRGENVPHYGRFLMSTYLLAVGKSVDDIMALFPKAPDFKPSITKYQVEHIAGIRGGKKRVQCSVLQNTSN